jgi:hypothetical protein
MSIIDFTFYLFMAGNPVLSTGDIAKETGLSRQRIWQLGVTGEIPAERANPGGKHYRFYDSAEFAAWRKQKARQSARSRASQVRRASRISRQEKIEKLFEILKNQTEVSAREKEAALSYFDCLFRLWRMRQVRRVRRWKETQLPLLEGIHALYGSKITFRKKHMEYIAMKYFISDLPTRSKTTPRNGQFSLNASG